jgi:indolepyruvate decarboxylase
MFADKTVIDEDHPNYIGMYDGLLMKEAVREFVESSDLLITIGTMQSAFNTGAFTARLDPTRTIDIGLHRTAAGSRVFQNVEMAELLTALATRDFRARSAAGLRPSTLGAITGARSEAITAAAPYPRPTGSRPASPHPANSMMHLPRRHSATAPFMSK